MTTGDYKVSLSVVNPDGSAKNLRGTLTLSNIVPPDIDPPDPIDPPVMGDIGLTYVRKIGLPSLNMGFAYGDCTGRIVDGKVRLLFTGDVVLGSPINEVEISDEPVATLVRSWNDPYKGKRGTWMQVASMLSSSRGYRDLAKKLHLPHLHQLATLFFLLYSKARKEGKSGNDWEYVDFAGNNSVVTTGHYYHPELDLFFTTYGDTYNVTGRPDWNCVALQLNDDGTTEAYGPFRFAGMDPDGSMRFGTRISSCLRAHPVSGLVLTSTAMSSGNSGYPWGANLHGGAQWPTRTMPVGPGNDLMLPDKYLWHYYMGTEIDRVSGIANGPVRSQRRPIDAYIYDGDANQQSNFINPIHYNGIGSWTDNDTLGGFVPLEDRVMFFAGVSGSPILDPTNCLACHIWYATGLNNYRCPHGCDAVPAGITGPVATARYPAAFNYDWSDLNRVRDGDAVDYEQEPTAWSNLEKDYDIVTAPVSSVGNAKMNATGFFNAATRRLYTIAQGADQGEVTWGLINAYIHEWQVQ